jgi:hypothetical protein
MSSRLITQKDEAERWATSEQSRLPERDAVTDSEYALAQSHDLLFGKRAPESEGKRFLSLIEINLHTSSRIKSGLGHDSELFLLLVKQASNAVIDLEHS